MIDFEAMNTDHILQKMGDSIRGARVSQELTMKDLAEKSEISVTSLSRIENGKTNPTIMILVRIFKALGREKEIANLTTVRKKNQINSIAYSCRIPLVCIANS